MHHGAPGHPPLRWRLGCASIAAMLTSLLATPILLVSLINVHSSFLATFASSLDCGDWRCSCRFALPRPRCLVASIAAMLASLLATPIACEPDQCVCFIPCHLCKQPALWGLALRVDSHCSAGVVWVDQHCCHDGIMACQHSLCWCALLLPRIAWLTPR